MSYTFNTISVVLLAVLAFSALSGLGYHFWATQDIGNNERTAQQAIPIGRWASVAVTKKGIELTVKKRANGNNESMNGFLARSLNSFQMINCTLKGNNKKVQLCLEGKGDFRLEISQREKNVRLSKKDDLECSTIFWRPPVNSRVKETPEDCYDLSQFHWFGGFEESCQAWPMNGYNINSSPFITADSYMGRVFGSVIEGIFLSSFGFGIIVDETTPLYVSINEGGSPLLCLKGKVGDDTPFFNVTQPFLKYDICVSDNILTLWKGVAARHISKPTLTPLYDVLRHPIWCTWAVYKDKIDQKIILDYANLIIAHNFSISQLEIDDSWTAHYGDFNFTSDRFPNAIAMIKNLTSLGIPTSVWVHPFFNKDSQAFKELANKGFLVKDFDSDAPLTVSWWRSNKNASILDVTNPEAVKWYLGQLDYLKTMFNVTSFKFDAGEAIWYPGKYKLQNPLATPNYLSQKYIELALQSDPKRRQEMRVGFRSQNSSLMMRLIDRQSDWSHTLGIKTLIPASLVFGLMGYPYILPDMIGGDNNHLGLHTPDSELFVRWIQASAFLPVIQISIPPWHYGDTVNRVTRKYLQLHENYSDTIIALAENAVKTGEPIIRPLWWIAPQDKAALLSDSQFLLGDSLLVAPVLEKGAVTRDIYLPAGLWRDEQTGAYYEGGVWLRDYDAPLEVLPYFSKVS